MAMFVVLGRVGCCCCAILGVVGVNGFSSGAIAVTGISCLGEEGAFAGSSRGWGIGGRGSCGGCEGGGSAATCAGVY